MCGPRQGGAPVAQVRGHGHWGRGHPPIRQWPNQSVGYRISRAPPIMGHREAPATPNPHLSALIWALGKIIRMEWTGFRWMRGGSVEQHKHELSPDRQLECAGDIDRRRGEYIGAAGVGGSTPCRALFPLIRWRPAHPKGALPASTQMSSNLPPSKRFLFLLQPGSFQAFGLHVCKALYRTLRGHSTALGQIYTRVVAYTAEQIGEFAF